MHNGISWEENKYYRISAQGFSEPIEGKVVKVDFDAAGNVVLVIQTDTEIINLFVSAITGWTELPSKVDRAA